MQVHVGPVASASALVWIAFARDVLGRVADDPGTTRLPDDARDRFVAYLDDWQRAAERSPILTWESEVDPDQLEFLALAFVRIAQSLAAGAPPDQVPTGPAEGLDFYQGLVAGILEALTAEDGARAEFAEQLRQTWPGLAE